MLEIRWKALTCSFDWARVGAVREWPGWGRHRQRAEGKSFALAPPAPFLMNGRHPYVVPFARPERPARYVEPRGLPIESAPVSLDSDRHELHQTGTAPRPKCNHGDLG